jgi:exodeoxyribonuclease VII large subunit
LHTVYDSIIGIEPHRLLGERKVDLNNFRNRANTAVTATVNRLRLQLTASENRLAALNPKSVLQRGYSITTSKKTGFLVRVLDDVQIDDSLITELAGENLIESKVVKKQNRVDTNQGS